MGMLKKKARKNINDYQAVDTRPTRAFQPFTNNNDRKSNYNSRRDATVRIDKTTQQRIKALSYMRTREYGDTIREVTKNVMDQIIEGFDDQTLAWFQDELERIKEEDVSGK